jgi:dTDP-4-dehydrorhamnose reductase
MTCGGSVSWCGFAQAIFAHAGAVLDGKMTLVNPISTSEYPTPAKRPLNSCLSNEKLEARFAVRLAPWESALDEALRRLASTQLSI